MTAAEPKNDSCLSCDDPDFDPPAKVRSDIEEGPGWTVIGIPDASPPFAYTIGLTEKYDHPELIILGLDVATMHHVLNIAGTMVRDEGRTFAAGTVVDSLLTMPTEIRSVHSAILPEYFEIALHHYGEWAFEALQIVWPDTQGKFPGDPDFERKFAGRQPDLQGALA